VKIQDFSTSDALLKAVGMAVLCGIR